MMKLALQPYDRRGETYPREKRMPPFQLFTKRINHFDKNGSSSTGWSWPCNHFILHYYLHVSRSFVRYRRIGGAQGRRFAWWVVWVVRPKVAPKKWRESCIFERLDKQQQEDSAFHVQTLRKRKWAIYAPRDSRLKNSFVLLSNFYNHVWLV